MNKRNAFLQATLALVGLVIMVQVHAQTISSTAPKAANQKQKSLTIESQQATQQMKILAQMDAKNTQTLQGNLGAFAAMPPMPPMPAIGTMPEFSERMEMPEMPELPEMRELAEVNGNAYFNGRNFTNVADLKSKEVSQEITVSKSADIYIDNSSRNIVIKTWDQPKVKITTTVYFEGDGKLSDEEWFEKLNISLKTLGTSIKIKSGSIGGGSYTMNGATYGWSGQPNNNVAIFNGKGEDIGSKNNIKRVVTIYIPNSNKLDVESKYADVQIAGKINNATIDLTNGNLDAEDFTKLYLRSKYANATVGNIANAEIDFMNGRLTTGNLVDADMDTKYSTVEMATVKNLVFRSTNDEYEIEVIDHLRGRKNYGNLRIAQLFGSLELDGTNADVKVRRINSDVNLIRIDNKYADIRLPLREVKNYAIQYSGPFSTVYGNFEKAPLKEEPKAVAPKTKGDGLSDMLVDINRSIARANLEQSIDTRFSAVGGDGKGLKIDMKCQNCTVDFK